MNERREEEQENLITLAWLTANFTGAALAGKLKSLDFYISQMKKASSFKPKAPQQTKEMLIAEAKKHNLKGPWDKT